jgi:short-subunit dehydrogenase
MTAVVLVTGAGSGIGRALAVEAGRIGRRLVLVGRRRDPLEETAASLGPNVSCVVGDVTTPEGRGAIRTAVADLGRLDILINNAGTVVSGPADRIDDADLMRTVATNVIAPMALTRELLPWLVASRGQVVNMGSVFGDIAFPYFAAYSATKFALRGYSDALRRELAPQGVAVTYLAPRGLRTAAADGFAGLVAPMGMALDDPEAAARRAWRAIAARRASQYPKTRERFFVALQRVRPMLIDRALSKMAGDPEVIAAARGKW